MIISGILFFPFQPVQEAQYVLHPGLEHYLDRYPVEHMLGTVLRLPCCPFLAHMTRSPHLSSPSASSAEDTVSRALGDLDFSVAVKQSLWPQGIEKHLIAHLANELQAALIDHEPGTVS